MNASKADTWWAETLRGFGVIGSEIAAWWHRFTDPLTRIEAETARERRRAKRLQDLLEAENKLAEARRHNTQMRAAIKRLGKRQ